MLQRGSPRQYKQVGIQTANRGKLIVMLYQGAIRNMRRAQLLIEKGDMEGKGEALIRAQDIILELLYALDRDMIEKGDELATNLERLYLYAYRRLVTANIQVDSQIIEEIVGLMSDLLDAWEAVVSGGVAVGSAEPPGESAGLALTG